MKNWSLPPLYAGIQLILALNQSGITVTLYGACGVVTGIATDNTVYLININSSLLFKNYKDISLKGAISWFYLKNFHNDYNLGIFNGQPKFESFPCHEAHKVNFYCAKLNQDILYRVNNM